MKKTLSALVLVFASSTAFAFHCPQDMAKIDKNLTEEPMITDDQMVAVKELRAVGEQLHNNGKHHAAVAVLGEAMDILGIEH